MAIADANVNNASSPATPLTSPSNSAKPKHLTNLGAIIGGVIGGAVVLLLMIALAVIVARRRRRKKNSLALAEPFNEAGTRDSTHLAITPADNRRQSEKPFLSVIPHSSSGPSTMSPSSAVSSPFQALDGSGQISRPVQDEEERQGVNLGSLMWQLNEFLRGGSHGYNANEEPPVYSPSNPTPV
jgi:hypothetical protein